MADPRGPWSRETLIYFRQDTVGKKIDTPTDLVGHLMYIALIGDGVNGSPPLKRRSR